MTGSGILWRERDPAIFDYRFVKRAEEGEKDLRFAVFS